MMIPRGFNDRSLRLLAALAVGLMVVWAFTNAYFEWARFTVYAPQNRTELEVLGGLFRVFGALVLFLLPADGVGRRLRWVAGGLLVLALGGLLFGFVDLYSEGSRWNLDDSMYLSLLARTFAGTMFVVGLLPEEPPRFTLRRMVAILVAFSALNFVVEVVKGLLPPMVLVESLNGVAQGSARSLEWLTAWHWVLSAIPLGLAVAAVAGIAYRGIQGPQRIWLSTAMILLAGSQLHYLLWPPGYGAVITTSDLLRFAYTMVIVLGGVLELRRVVTERSSLLASEREAKARYRALVEQIPAVTYVREAGEPGDLLYVSPQIEATQGYRPKEMVSHPEYWTETLHPEDRERVLTDYRRADASGTPLSTEYRRLTSDGREVHVREEAVIVHAEDGAENRSLYWQGILLDITEGKQIEEKLREANESLQELAVLKADFTAMVAHELAHPLAVVGGFADLLRGDGLKPAERERALARIGSETEILKVLVADVRAAASIERDDFDLWLRPVRVGELLDAATTYAATLAGAHPFEVETSADGWVMADQYRIEQVLRNLISNAAKYSPSGAPIELRALPSEDFGHVRIEVVDHGYGVRPDDVARIFEKFGRGRNKQGQRVAGAGLGLYLSRRILRAHGSELTLDSPPEGGSVFGFELEVSG